MDSERREQILQLLRSRDDHLEVLRARPSGSSGFVHRVTVRLSCEDCLANGKVSYHCETCHGRGYVEGVRGRDPYDTGVSGFALGVHDRRRERDAEIERLAAQVAEPGAGDFAVVGERWERVRASRWRRYDFAALDSALEWLRDGDSSAYHAAMAAMYAWTFVSEHLERALELLDPRLPVPLRVPGLELSERSRDAAIVELVAGGESSAVVARRFGLSVRRVNEIVARSPLGES